jgi:hypothetical protein
MLSRDINDLEDRNPSDLSDGCRSITDCADEKDDDINDWREVWREIRSDINVDSRTIKDTGFYSDSLDNKEIEEKFMRKYLWCKTPESLPHEDGHGVTIAYYLGDTLREWDRNREEEEFYTFVEEIYESGAHTRLDKNDYRNIAAGTAVLKLLNG